MDWPLLQIRSLRPMLARSRVCWRAVRQRYVSTGDDSNYSYERKTRNRNPLTILFIPLSYSVTRARIVRPVENLSTLFSHSPTPVHILLPR